MSAQPSTQPGVAMREWRTPLELGFLGIVWGCSFLFMRVAVPSFGPFALVEVRLVLGALVLLPFLWRARAQFPPRRWLWLAPIGLVNSALPFVLFAYAAERAPAAIGAICNAMTVLFAALIAFLFFGEKIGVRRAGALLVGFAGVAVTDQPDTNFLSHGISSCWLTTDPFDLTPCGRMEQEVNEMLIRSEAGVAKRAARRRDAELSG